MAGFDEMIKTLLCGPTAKWRVELAKSDPVHRKSFASDQADDWAATAHEFGAYGHLDAQSRAMEISDAWLALAR